MTAEIERFQNYYNKKENKEKLVALIKERGKFITLTKEHGYIYSVPVSSSGNEGVIEVGLKSGNIVILEKSQLIQVNKAQ